MGQCNSIRDTADVVDLCQAAKRLRTGDILLFEGSGCFSRMVRYGTNSSFSHIAIVLKTDFFKKKRRDSDELIDVDPHQLYMLHSINGGIKGIKDLLTNKVRSGVQVNSLTKCMSCCITDVYFRRFYMPGEKSGDPDREGPYIHEEEIRRPPKDKVEQKTSSDIRNRDFSVSDVYDDGRQRPTKTKMTRFLEWVHEKPYELVFMDMVDSAVFFMPHPRDKKDSFFCSELVADFYKYFGILPSHVNASEYTPKDFYNMTNVDCDYEETYSYYSEQPSIQSSGCYFGKTIRLVLNL
jgi:hypothetical protein